MFNSIIEAFKAKDIRNKILFTVLVIIIMRIGCQFPIPGTDSDIIKSIVSGASTDLLSFFDALTGSSFSNMSIFALNVTVYITASIIVQLMGMAIPKIEEMQKDGDEGKKKITKLTRYLTLILAVAESVAMVLGFGKQGVFGSVYANDYVFKVIVAVCILTAGAMISMWLGEQITEHGIGNGISVILLINILSTMPGDYIGLFNNYVLCAENIWYALLGGFVIVALSIAIIVFIVQLNGAERRIHTVYSQKTGVMSFGKNGSYMPIKVNTAGVIPIIFTSSLLQFPVLIHEFIVGGTPEWTKYLVSSYWFNPSEWKYTLGVILYIALTILFAYYYTNITFNPAQIAENLQKQGGFIPGVRPGKPTEEYLSHIMKYLIFIGAIALLIVAIVPMAVCGIVNTEISFAGTSLIIVVSVTIETINKLNSLLVGRNYTGFFVRDKKGAARC